MNGLLGLLTYPQISPVALRIGPLAVRWYGLAYVAGFIAAYVLLYRMVRRDVFHITRDQLASLVTWLAVGVMVGGRVGWWMFYHLPTGESAPWYGIFETWNGGMSFHGGLLGVAIAMAAYCGYHRVSFLHVADAAALVTPIGLFCGRIANFINGELYGRASSVPWAMIFPRDPAGIPRHPSQLYEALLEGPVLMGLLWLARRYLHPRQGRIAALFLILYGLARFGVEFTRQPDADLGFIAWGWLTMGQLLSVALLAGGVLMYALIRPRHRAADVPAPATAKSMARQRVSNR